MKLLPLCNSYRRVWLLSAVLFIWSAAVAGACPPAWNHVWSVPFVGGAAGFYEYTGTFDVGAGGFFEKPVLVVHIAGWSRRFPGLTAWGAAGILGGALSLAAVGGVAIVPASRGLRS